MRSSAKAQAHKILFPGIIFLLLLTFLSEASVASGWSVYTTEHFSLYSDDNEKNVRSLLRDFEVFRSSVLTVTGIEDKPENSRMIILQYANSKAFRKIAPKNSGGFYSNTSAGPRMVIGPGGQAKYDRAILFHEYVHYLMREHSLIVYPKWYSEGFSEVLGSTTIKGGRVTIGAIPPGMNRFLHTERVMRIEELLNPNYELQHASYLGRFYSHAWLFTHLLQIGTLTENGHLRQQTSEYLQRVHDGEDATDAFTDSFRMTPREMDKELTRYRRSRRLVAVELNIGEYKGVIQRRQLDANEQVFLLADIAWRRGEEKVSLKYLEDIHPEAANAARPLSLSAVLKNHAGNTGRAKSEAAQALSLAPDDTQVLSNLSHLEYDYFDSANKKDENSRASLQKSIEYGEKAIEVDPGNREAYYFLQLSYIANTQDSKAAKAMMSAFQIAPSSVSINFDIGSFTFERGYYDLAKPFLERVLAWSHSVEEQMKVREMLSQIDGAATAD